MSALQKKRLISRSLFFALFVLAPLLDIFRFDLTLNHFILFGQPWTLGFSELQSGEAGSFEATSRILLRGFLPLFIFIGAGAWVAWRWGRLYCGWLCPHFSVVETINSLMRRASGKPSIWERAALPEKQSDGVAIKPDSRWWWLTAVAVFGFSLLWAVTLLTYLLPPGEIWLNLFTGTLTTRQIAFITVATLLLMIEFTFARHLFCRFGCAVGVFQSLIWMGNRRSMVVGFDRSRSEICADCDASCEHACPMRLKPRGIKRKMFTCTQCAQCIQACERVQSSSLEYPLLKFLHNECALDVSSRDFGNRPEVPAECFRRQG